VLLILSILGNLYKDSPVLGYFAKKQVKYFHVVQLQNLHPIPSVLD
jgi:hypothetical protein